MKYICIAKKVSHQNVEFLDFGTDDQDRLIVFDKFKDASEFLKQNVGTGEELLEYIITSTEAQQNNPRMIEILKKGVVKHTPDGSTTIEEPKKADISTSTEKSELECMFVFEADSYEIVNNQKVYDKANNRTLVPVMVFIDEKDPSKPATVTNFALKNVFVDKFNSEENG